MIDIQDAIDNGISPARAEFLADCERYCENHYEYETSHEDAADSYSVCFTDEFNIDNSDVKRFYFDYFHNADENEPTVYLGNGEVEIQLPRPLTEVEADYFSRNTDYVVNGASDLAYRTYDDQLIVRAELYE